ncbi:MAG: glycosyltransferase [Desulfamplus sp.]|nr:glycosyltransferase [Desulfamplus sp.]
MSKIKKKNLSEKKAYLTMVESIKAKDFDRFNELWNLNKEMILTKPIFQKEILTKLEQTEEWNILEVVLFFLLQHKEQLKSDIHETVLTYSIFISRKNNDIERLETSITEFLDSTDGYKSIPIEISIIIAEFLLKKDMGNFFLDITLALFERMLINEIKIINNSDELAHGYSLIAEREPQTERGILIASICLNIAWGLTEDKKYLVKLKNLQKPAKSFNTETTFAQVITNNQYSIKNQKVLHGTYEIANQMFTITRALRKEGFIADTVSYYPNYLGYKSDHVLDINSFSSIEKANLETKKYAQKLINEYDIFHFHFSSTLTLDYSDLPMLNQLSKKRISHYWGSEVRMLSIGKRINPYVKVKQTDENMIKRKLEYFAKYIPHAVVGDYELFEYVKDFHNFVHVIPAAIIIEDYPFVGVNDTNTLPLLVHAPTSPEIKGSKYILKAIEDLRADYKFDFKLIQNTSHAEAKKWYAKANLIIDELHCGTYGLLTIELMSMGKPVLTWISDYMREKYPNELPVVSANPDNIKEKIAYMLNNRDMFSELGRQGRKYVEKYHDVNHVAKQIISIYEAL